ncbi:hypothetical protein [Clostridium sp. LP20]|uniref:hypothetical protein n=1 Tax=Clostridium sp. LP20 TaxID=3418665 RepID=UPI003EE4E7C2
MEYITVEQFREQPEEVQKVFLDWWKPILGDIFNIEMVVQEQDIYNGIPYDICDNYITVVDHKTLKYGDGFVKNGLDGVVTPLFTEGQLRKFIEDKTKCVMSSSWDCWSRDNGIETFDYRFHFSNWDGLAKSHNAIKLKECTDMFQAYWKIACMVAKEGLR